MNHVSVAYLYLAYKDQPLALVTMITNIQIYFVSREMLEQPRVNSLCIRFVPWSLIYGNTWLDATALHDRQQTGRHYST
jgi:hypothetical protein